MVLLAVACSGSRLRLKAISRDARLLQRVELAVRRISGVRLSASLEGAVSEVHTPAALSGWALSLKNAKCSIEKDKVHVAVAVESQAPAARSVRQAAASLRQAVQERVDSAYRQLTGAAPAALTVDYTVQGPANFQRSCMQAAGAGLGSVGAVIAVSSGKGGVGKSTVAVNLAATLSRMGARVGILDADIQGPSLPTLLRPDAARAAAAAGAAAGGWSLADSEFRVAKLANGRVEPAAVTLEGSRHPLQCMSYGWACPRPVPGRSSAAVVRGPVASSIVQQLAKLTEWGTLDYLILDTPPGTGDIHITLGQSLPITTAVVVTTPQRLALVDVVKGLDMWRSLHVPTSALVVNMSSYTVRDSQGKAMLTHPLGNWSNRATELAQSGHGFPQEHTYLVPLEDQVTEAGDSGVPLVVLHPGSETAALYQQLACEVAERARFQVALVDGNEQLGQGRAVGTQETERPTHQRSTAAASASSPSASAAAAAASSLSLRYDSSRGSMLIRSYSEEGAKEIALPPKQLRLACQCAGCRGENGQSRSDPARIPDDVVPASLQAQGNYAFAVHWSDGHTSSIYTKAQLAELAEQARDSRPEKLP